MPFKNFVHRFLLSLLLLPAGLAWGQSGCAGVFHPSDLLTDLNWAMTGQSGAVPFPNWQNCLEPSYNSWSGQGQGSENLPVIAHAIGLWTGLAGGTDGVSWWAGFLTCQAGLGCFSGAPTYLAYMKGTELLSDVYDNYTTIAIASVSVWAQIHSRPLLLQYSQDYMRITWGLYVLSAGVGPSSHYIIQYPPPAGQDCQVKEITFLALAGMRSDPSFYCDDNRGRLLERALQDSNGAPEDSSQVTLANTLHSLWNPTLDPNDRNEYGLAASERSVLLGHELSPTPASLSLLASLVGNIRTSVNYHFLAWTVPAANGQTQVRATLMEGNLNCNTAATYGEMYTYSPSGGGFAQVLFPWTNGEWRSGITGMGIGELLPNATNPTSAQASNVPANFCGGVNAINPPSTVTMNLPTNGARLYHWVFSPNQAVIME